jgi:casein kinase 1
MKNILQDLANLKLGDRKILGDRKNVVVTSNDDEKGCDTPKANRLADVVEISSGSEELPAPTVIPKADRLVQLAKAVPGATDNLALSNIITDFITALQSNTSRILTKEGFAFLDVLYNQLADPSVYILCHRTIQTRSSDKEQVPDLGSQRMRLDAVARLKKEVRQATGNQALATMVADFRAVMNKGRRTITKDGWEFLSGLAERLVELR